MFNNKKFSFEPISVTLVRLHWTYNYNQYKYISYSTIYVIYTYRTYSNIDMKT